MAEVLKDLARRAMASPHWRWERGIVLLGKGAPLVAHARYLPGAISLYIELERQTFYVSGYLVDGVCHWMSSAHTADPLPDLSHPATFGIVRARVRELREDPGWTPVPLFDGAEEVWIIDAPSRERQTRYASEEEALVVALRAFDALSPSEPV